MRTFGTGGRLADVEARIEAEMRAASAEGWILTDAAGLGDPVAKCCCALGAVGREKIGQFEDVHAKICNTLGIKDGEFADIGSGFDGESFDPDTNENVAMGRRLRVLADRLNLERVQRVGAQT